MTASIDIVRLEHKNVWRVPSGALNFKLEEAYQSAAAMPKPPSSSIRGGSNRKSGNLKLHAADADTLRRLSRRASTSWPPRSARGDQYLRERR